MLNPNVIKLRGTIFLSNTIGYSSANESKYKELFPDYFVAPAAPSSLQIGPSGIQLIQTGKLENGGPWQLVAGNTCIVFSPVRIDIIRDVVSPFGSVESDFCAFCSSVFSAILDKENVDANRLAFAPIYAKDNDGSFQSQMLWSDQLKYSTYGDASIEEANLTYNYRLVKEFGSRDMTVNFKTTISDAQKQLPSGVIIQGCITINIDINTSVNQNFPPIFSKSDIEDFFAKASGWDIDFMNSNINK